MPTTVETYEQAIEYLFGRINYERVHSKDFTARDFKLDRVERLLSELGNPQDSVPCVHIAGTKGKGSTAVMVSHILSAAGYRTGLFTSPHIEAFEERMRIDGVSPPRDELVELVNDVVPAVTKLDRLPGKMNPTYFEIATVMAWRFFASRGVDLAVVEVGLGGRLDATNICRSLVTVITSISRDHMNVLGSSIRQIASEKAGIIKPDVPVVSGVTHPEASDEIRRHARKRGADMWEIGSDFSIEMAESSEPGNLTISTPRRDWKSVPQQLAGQHQAINTGIAVSTVDAINDLGYEIDEHAVYTGLSQVHLPVRIEVLRQNPIVLVDAAHNWESTQALVATIDSRFSVDRRILVFSTSKDKDVTGMLRLLSPCFDTVILTQYQNNPRAESVDKLKQAFVSTSDRPIHVAPDPASAWKLAQHIARENDLICVTGSFFIASEMREIVLDTTAESLVDRTQIERHSL